MFSFIIFFGANFLQKLFIRNSTFLILICFHENNTVYKYLFAISKSICFCSAIILKLLPEFTMVKIDF